MYEYIGNIHIHSKYSDGSKSIKEIAAVAKTTGLDFIIITDHFNLDGLHNNEEGYIHGVLVLVGMEVNDTCNHYLALDIKKVVENNTSKPQEVIDEVNRQGGIGVIAHPVEKGTPLFYDGRTYEWVDWTVEDFQGIEIWNFLSQYKDSFTNIPAALFFLIYPHLALTGPYKKTMEIFDNYQKKGKNIIAFGGSDAHGIKLKLGPIKITVAPYDLSFKCINMHILTGKKLTGDPAGDKGIIYNSLRKGNAWISYDYFKNSRGFRFELKKGTRVWPMGSQVPYQNDLQIKIKTPLKAKIKVIKNGSLWQQKKGHSHTFYGIDKGIYRVEAYHCHLWGYRPWIFSNSIIVG